MLIDGVSKGESVGQVPSVLQNRVRASLQQRAEGAHRCFEGQSHGVKVKNRYIATGHRDWGRSILEVE